MLPLEIKKLLLEIQVHTNKAMTLGHTYVLGLIRQELEYQDAVQVYLAMEEEIRERFDNVLKKTMENWNTIVSTIRRIDEGIKESLNENVAMQWYCLENYGCSVYSSECVAQHYIELYGGDIVRYDPDSPLNLEINIEKVKERKTK